MSGAAAITYYYRQRPKVLQDARSPYPHAGETEWRPSAFRPSHACLHRSARLERAQHGFAFTSATIHPPAGRRLRARTDVACPFSFPWFLFFVLFCLAWGCRRAAEISRGPQQRRPIFLLDPARSRQETFLHPSRCLAVFKQRDAAPSAERDHVWPSGRGTARSPAHNVGDCPATWRLQITGRHSPRRSPSPTGWVD